MSRKNAVIWARKILKEPFVVLDTETTGIHDAEPCSIAVVSSSGRVLLDCLLKPSKPISSVAYDIHGISNEDVKDLPSFKDYRNIIYNLTREKILLGYNVAFDINAINESCRLQSVPALKFAANCAMIAYAEFAGEWNDYHRNYKWHKLSEAAEFFGIDTSTAHGAVADCLMTLEVVRCMAKSIIEEN